MPRWWVQFACVHDHFAGTFSDLRSRGLETLHGTGEAKSEAEEFC